MARPEAAAETVDRPGSETDPLLRVEQLGASYGRRQVVFDVSLEVRDGEAVTILGHNGAGKTTTLKTIFGLLEATSGRVLYRGRDVARMSCAERVSQGMTFVPAQQFVFAGLSVSENLRLGGQTERSSDVIGQRLESVHDLFPILAERQSQVAGTMSGGQQRILSIGMALMAGPKLMLLDEPSLGLAPGVLKDITATLRRLVAGQGVSILILEQNVIQALEVADRAYVMRSGRVILEESATDMRARGQWWDLF